MTNPEMDLYGLECNLKGIAEDKDGNIIKTGEPLMNSDGIQYVLALVQSVCNRITFFGKYDDKRLNRMMLHFWETLTGKLMTSRSSFGIKNSQDRDLIVTLATNYAQASIIRALENGERGFWKGSQQDINVKNQTINKEGALQKLLGWRNKD